MDISAVADKIRNSDAFPKDVPPEERPIIADILENLDTAMPATKDYKGNYEIQIGEIAGPIALSKGSSMVGGAVAEAQEQLLQVIEPGLTWQAMKTVEYPADESQKLIDSFIISPLPLGNEKSNNELLILELSTPSEDANEYEANRL